MDKLRRRNGETAGKNTIITSNGVNEKSGKPQSFDDISNKMSIVNVRQRMERLRHDVVNHVGDQFDDMMSEVMDGLEAITRFQTGDALRLNETEKLYCDKKETSEDGRLPEKQFLCRNSVLTDLYEVKHFRTIHNVFISFLIILCLNAVAHDLLHTGTTNIGVTLIMTGFGKFSSVIEIWLLMFATSMSVYPAGSFWASRRAEMPRKSLKMKVWDFSWLLIYIAFQIAFIILPPYGIVLRQLPPVSSTVILTEQVRMVMKIHAFVRSNVPVVTSYKPHSEGKELAYPNFYKFLYFMFAPTLVYRDSYPRTKEIRWGFVAWHLLEVVLIIFSMSFVFERTLIPPFMEFGKHPFELRSFILTSIGYSFPGLLILLDGFYCLLHSWLNAAAEVMKFGDRLFYKDWWNSTSYSTWYRRWNVVVHDWLYTYVYKDMYEIVTPGNRIIPTTAVFFISAIFHEYIMAFTFGFFFPVMLSMFGVFGYLLLFILRTTNQAGNLFIWCSLCMGSGIMIGLYSTEYFARVNCPPYTEGVWDLLLPRIFSCVYKSHEETVNI